MSKAAELAKLATGVFNDASADVDFRVESNGQANMLFVDGGNDRVNIGHNASVAGKFNISEAGGQGLEVVLSDADDIDLLFYNRANSAYIKANYNAEQHIFSGHGNQTTNNSLTIDSIGAMTNAAQPCFLIQAGAATNNIANNITVTFGAERFDVGNNFASNTFTAPVTGKYFLACALRIDNFDSACNFLQLEIKTSNRSYIEIVDKRQTNGDTEYNSFHLSVLADMDASDTAHIVVSQNGGTAQADVIDDDSRTYFSGYLAC
jgi:prepilin-type processing-associated H-X9-DG protein